MKDGVKDIVGKEIAAVVMGSSADKPSQQVFIVFTDGSCIEFRGGDLDCSAELDDAVSIVDYFRSGRGEISHIYGDPEAWRRKAAPVLTTGGEAAPYHVPAPETLRSKLERDVKAWKAAKAAIARARRP